MTQAGEITRSGPTAVPAGVLDAAFARLDAAMPEGWSLNSVNNWSYGKAEKWWALAFGPNTGAKPCSCCGKITKPERESEHATGKTVAEAIDNLTAKLKARVEIGLPA